MEQTQFARSNLNNVWRVCRKIQAAAFRININIRDSFEPDLTEKQGFISESKFVSALERLKDIIGLSDTEIKEVTDYFRIQDGRISCDQFCKVLIEEKHSETNKDFVTGLERNDPFKTNVISISDQKRLCILLTKIAQTVRLRDIPLLPYFQDYKLVSGNTGEVTIAHFSRILNFLKIQISEKDFPLLLKKYIQNSNTINYVAFIKDIEKLVQYFDKNRLLDHSQDFMENFPVKVIDVDLSNATAAQFLEVDEKVHPVFSNEEISLEFDAIISKIKKYVFENRVEIHNFFDEFDRHCSGYISSKQFIRALDSMGVSRLSRLYLTEDQLKVLVEHYACLRDVDKVNWKKFEEDINMVFHEREYVSKPYSVISCPIENSSVVMQKYSNAGETDLLERAHFQVQATIKKRRLYLLEFFRDYDRLNHGRVSCRQFRQVLNANGIILSKAEMSALENKYRTDDTINYVKFLLEVDPSLQQEPLEVEYRTRTMKPIGIDNNLEQTILVMAKVKRQVVNKRVRLVDFLKYYDRDNKMSIKEDQFRRALSNAHINLEPQEMDLLCSIFKLPFSENIIEYRRFCDSVEETFVQNNFERANPLEHLPSPDNQGIFLNLEKESLLPIALKKLTKLHEYQVSSIKIDFADHDKDKTGRVSHYDFMSVLGKADVLNLLSNHETSSIFQNFSVQMGKHHKFDYKAFLKFLETLKEMSGEVN